MLQVGDEILAKGKPIRLLQRAPEYPQEDGLEFWWVEVLFDAPRVDAMILDTNVKYKTLREAPGFMSFQDWKASYARQCH